MALRTMGGFVLLTLLMIAGSFWLRKELTVAGVLFVEKLGLAGVFLGIVAADGFTCPVPPAAYIAAAVTGGGRAVPLLLVACAASLLGGTIAFHLGKLSEQLRWLKVRVDPLRARTEAMLSRGGIVAIMLAGWTPIPFSMLCVSAGVFRLPFWKFTLILLMRVPRIVLYYFAIVAGWTVGA